MNEQTTYGDDFRWKPVYDADKQDKQMLNLYAKYFKFIQEEHRKAKELEKRADAFAGDNLRGLLNL